MKKITFVPVFSLILLISGFSRMSAKNLKIDFYQPRHVHLAYGGDDL